MAFDLKTYATNPHGFSQAQKRELSKRFGIPEDKIIEIPKPR